MVCFMYQCINNKTPGYFCTMFSKNFDYYTYDRRRKNREHITGCRQTLRKQTIHYGPKLWNSLPLNIVAVLLLHHYIALNVNKSTICKLRY